ncbi:hypothetical protein EMIT0P291_280036 [Pseudomonas sp. IT-P291]
MKKPGYHTRSLNWQRRAKVSEVSCEVQAPWEMEKLETNYRFQTNKKSSKAGRDAAYV